MHLILYLSLIFLVMFNLRDFHVMFIAFVSVVFFLLLLFLHNKINRHIQFVMSVLLLWHSGVITIQGSHLREKTAFFTQKKEQAMQI